MQCLLSYYKAPRVDGFQLVFFKNFLDVLANDVWEMVGIALTSSSFNYGLAKNIIVTIPKIDAPISFKDFTHKPRQCSL